MSSVKMEEKRTDAKAADKRIDFVLVVDSSIRHSKNLSLIITYIKSLEDVGLALEITENVYITIHLPPKAVKHFASIYDINIGDQGHIYMPYSSMNLLNLHFFQTPLSGNRDLFRRQDEVTTKERIIIANELLSEAKFGYGENDYGLEKLTRTGVIKDAFPLHDGPWFLQEEDGTIVPDNDRQLLIKYWANWTLWYKEQPLNLIEKYFGTEVAFYFAWLGFYNKMLILAATVGVICSIISIIQLFFTHQERVHDICTSQQMMCPLCHAGIDCKYQPLSTSCHYAKFSIVFDNAATVFFAVFMSFWATFFLNFWKRYESTLKIRWNVEFEEMDTKLRVAYKERTKFRKWCPITSTMEPYVPQKIQAFYIVLSYGCCFLLILVIAMFVFGVIMYRVTLVIVLRRAGLYSWNAHASLILVITSALLQVLFIKLFELFYAPLSEWLTHLENPRTQTEFENSVIHKQYFMRFVNNYSGLFYIAFLKERFYDPRVKFSSIAYEIDVCGPTGCLMSLCIQLGVLMLCKSLLGNIFVMIIPCLKRRLKMARLPPSDTSQWEREYKLIPSRRGLNISDFMEMIIQYGFVTFFVAAFPLAPLLALINNCLELRIDAYKLVRRHRRPVPKQTSGMGAWNGIISIITHLSVATNAFVLAFTSDFVAREIYKYNNKNSLSGYINSTFSVFDLNDFEGDSGKPPKNPLDNSTLCYYKGDRQPPNHPSKYSLTPDFWYEMGMRLVCVLVFEHVILLTNGIIAYFIPAVPQTVRETLHYNRTKELELKLKAQTSSRGLRRRIPSMKLIRKGYV